MTQDIHTESECEVLTQTPQIFSKTHRFVSVPLNANELLPPAQGAELQELVCFVCVRAINRFLGAGFM